MQDLDPSDICKKKILNPLKRIRVIIRTPTHGRTDGRTDGRTNRVNPVYPPKLRFGGYNNRKIHQNLNQRGPKSETMFVVKEFIRRRYDNSKIYRLYTLTVLWRQSQIWTLKYMSQLVLRIYRATLMVYIHQISDWQYQMISSKTEISF